MAKRKSKFDRTEVSPSVWGILTVNLFYQLITGMREKIVHEIAEHPDQFAEPVCAGRRVLDSERVLRTLRSNCTEQQFIKEPLTMITEALLHLAETDAWYESEKKYAEPNELERNHHDHGGEG